MFQKKIIRENQDTMYSQELCFFEKYAVNEIMWKNMIKPDRPQTTIY